MKDLFTNPHKLLTPVLLVLLYSGSLFTAYKISWREKAAGDQAVQSIVDLVLKREQGFFDSYSTATRIEDVERYGLTSCTFFSRETAPKITLLDLREKKKCKDELLINDPITTRIRSRSGEVWQYTYAPATGRNFVLQLSQIFLMITIISYLLFRLWRKNHQAVMAVVESRKKIFMQVSHDSKSPLLALKEVLKTQQNIDSPSKRLIRQCISSLESMITSLDTDASLEGAQKIFLGSVVQTVLDEKKSELSKKSMIVDISMPDPMIKVAVNRVGLKRVVSNLLNNCLESGANQVKLEIRTDGQFVDIILTDNGAGISLAVLKKFRKQRFSTKGESRGFGLTGTLEFAQDSRGSFDIAPLAQGTRAVLRLPQVQDQKFTPKTYFVSKDHSVEFFPASSDLSESLPTGLMPRGTAKSTVKIIDLDRLETHHSFAHADESFIFVTSSDEEEINEGLVPKHCLLLPRNLLRHLPITKVARLISFEDSSLISAVWKAKSRAIGLPIHVFVDLEAFQEQKLSYVPGDVVFMDYELGDVKGTDIIPVLNHHWPCIWLATAHPQESLGQIPFIQGIIGKGFPVYDSDSPLISK